MARTVGLRFRQAGKIFYFDAGDLELAVSDYVVVETSYGLAVGRVVISPDQVIVNESASIDQAKPVLRKATPEDIDLSEEMKVRADDALHLAKHKVSEQGLDMSIASGEFDLEGSQFTAYFTATDRVDFRGLVRDLSQEINARVALLQVGDRDRAKLTDGFDICGERLCCSSWMTNFPSVSIRMAKEQDLPLNPQKISGVCGRLYCCLTFEYEDYKALRGTLPKLGSMLSTPAGEAKVLNIDFNREMVRLVLTASGEQIEIAAIDFKLQNGLTIRPMELVRKIEGPHRPISEDSSSRVQQPGRGRQPRRSPNQQPEAPTSQQPQRGPGPRPVQQPRAARPARPARPPRDVVEQAQQVVSEAQTNASPADAQKKRRRRRRGRGRGGDNAGAAGTPPPPA